MPDSRILVASGRELGQGRAKLLESLLFDLPHALTVKVQDLTHLLAKHSASGRDVERARFGKRFDVEVRETNFQAAVGHYLEKEVVPARHERAGPFAVDAVLARAWPLDWTERLKVIEHGEPDAFPLQLMPRKPRHVERSGLRWVFSLVARARLRLWRSRDLVLGNVCPSGTHDGCSVHALRVAQLLRGKELRKCCRSPLNC